MQFAVTFPRSGSSSTVSRSNQYLELLIFVEGGKLENPEKNPRSKDENQQQTQPTCDARPGNRTWDTAVGGECSRHCTIPCSPSTGIIGKLVPSNRQINFFYKSMRCDGRKKQNQHPSCDLTPYYTPHSLIYQKNKYINKYVINTCI